MVARAWRAREGAETLILSAGHIPMKLDLSEILANVGMQLPYEVSEPPIVDEDLECTTPIRGDLVFTNTGSVLLLDGKVQTRVARPCSRCSVYFEEEEIAPVNEQFTLEPKTVGPRHRHTLAVVEDDENPDATKLFDGPIFDLSELLRQSITLAESSRPLHDPECKGLCSHCGKDLNEGPCECRPEQPNPAFAALGALLNAKR